MQKSVELLDGCPLIIFVDLAVSFGSSLLRHATDVRPWTTFWRARDSWSDRLSITLGPLVVVRLESVQVSSWEASSWFGSWNSALLGVSRLRPLASNVAQDSWFLVSVFSFSTDFVVERFKIGFSQSIVGQELVDLVFDVLGELWLVAVLHLKLCNEHTFELFSLLDFLQSLASRLTHLRASLRPSCASYSGHIVLLNFLKLI